MSAELLARQLFAPPGAAPAHTRHLLAQAAGAHARLLGAASALREEPLDRLRAALDDYLRGPASAGEKRHLLDEPQFVESLHALAPTSAQLAGWDAVVAPGCQAEGDAQHSAIGRGWLAGVAAAVTLRRRRDWCGPIELATDAYGRVRLPFCDWTLVLVVERGDAREFFAHRTLVLDLHAQRACWSLPAPDSRPLLTMPRKTFDAMFIDNAPLETASGIEFCSRSPRARFERASTLGDTPIRFEPIGAEAPAAHAELTGGIVAAILAAIGANAPLIHDQLCQCIRTVHGFELPNCAGGNIASFSVPTSPGVMGFNVQYTPRDEPRLSPYAFMWLGHELGHTLHYLIDDVAHSHGYRFLENPLQRTPIVPRYGRSLYVRTLFQIPYVHLFEWWLLMLFHERGYAGLPWQMFDDAAAVGEEVRSEIADAFELIDAHAQPTATGRAVVERMRDLTAEAEARWRRLFLATARQRLTPRPNGVPRSRGRRRADP